MPFEIRDLKLSGDTLGKMNEVGNLCFGEGCAANNLISKNWQLSGPNSRFFGAYEDDKLVAFNGFTAHRILRGGTVRLMFQSCHSATHPASRGRGLLTKIINHAKTALAENGDYIIGFPNEKSEPIFLTKLNFQRVGMTRVYAPCFPARVSALLFESDAYAQAISDGSMIRIDQHAAASWKESEHPKEIVQHEYLTNFIWGRMTSRRKLGSTVRMLDAGGCELNKPWLLLETLSSLRRACGVSVVRFVCANNSALGQSWRWQFKGDKTEPLIWYALRDGLGAPKFDAHIGIKDVY